MSKLPNNTPEVLRKHGLKVKEIAGWQARGRPASTGGFEPVGVLCHHTATGPASNDDSVIRLLVEGRSDLPGPLCQFGLARDGTVYLVAAGRANHAGEAKAHGSVSGGDGNRLYIGIEAFNDGRGEKWTTKQYDAYVLLVAVLCKEFTHNSVRTVAGHKETSVTGKIDPTFNMDDFRRKVAAKIEQLGKPEKPKRPSRGGNVDTAIDALKEAKDKSKKAPKRLARVKAALKNLWKIEPFKK